jgi:hypothetical protein
MTRTSPFASQVDVAKRKGNRRLIRESIVLSEVQYPWCQYDEVKYDAHSLYSKYVNIIPIDWRIIATPQTQKSFQHFPLRVLGVYSTKAWY